MLMPPPRVVVTGIGVVTSIGVGVDPFWRALLEGRTGISPVTSFDTGRYRVHLGGEVKAFRPQDYVQTLPLEGMARASQLAIAAARLALADAGHVHGARDSHTVGVSMGTTSGEPEMIERFNDMELAGTRDGIGPAFVRQYPAHVIAAHVASELGCRGPNVVIPTACAAGNYALAHALDSIRNGEADVMLAGGSDAFSRITYSGFARLGAIAPERCQPFDRHRKGMIPGEGAALLVLEGLERAQARGARIYAELAGYGLTCDANHMTAPHGDGATLAMRRAMADAGVTPDEVGYISAHGTGTAVNDRIETHAVKQAFGQAAYRVPMSSIKSMLGHTMGAASAIEAAACALAVRNDVVPPTMHLEAPDPECDLDYVPNEARRQPVEVGDEQRVRLRRQQRLGDLPEVPAVTGRGVESSSPAWARSARSAIGRIASTTRSARGEQRSVRRRYFPPTSSPGTSSPRSRTSRRRRIWAHRNIRPLDRTGRLAAVGVELALADAPWPAAERRARGIGLILGTMFCSVRTIGEFDRRAQQAGPEYASPLDFSNTVLNAAAGQVAIWHGLPGVNTTIASGAVSGLHAIGYAATLIRTGRASVLVAGGAEEVCFESCYGF